MTLPGTTLGSVHYFSPEQARGEPATAASDIYSLGIVPVRDAHRRPPVGGRQRRRRRARPAVRPGPGPAPRPRRPCRPISPAITRKALALDPADRFASAASMADALDARSDPRRRGRRRGRCRRAAAAGAGAAAVRPASPAPTRRACLRRRMPMRPRRRRRAAPPRPAAPPARRGADRDPSPLGLGRRHRRDRAARGHRLPRLPARRRAGRPHPADRRRRPELRRHAVRRRDRRPPRTSGSSSCPRRERRTSRSARSSPRTRRPGRPSPAGDRVNVTVAGRRRHGAGPGPAQPDRSRGAAGDRRCRPVRRDPRPRRSTRSCRSGIVVSQNPPAGHRRRQGHAVDYVVSKGPEPTPTPEPDPDAHADPDADARPRPRPRHPRRRRRRPDADPDAETPYPDPSLRSGVGSSQRLQRGSSPARDPVDGLWRRQCLRASRVGLEACRRPRRIRSAEQAFHRRAGTRTARRASGSDPGRPPSRRGSRHRGVAAAAGRGRSSRAGRDRATEVPAGPTAVLER